MTRRAWLPHPARTIPRPPECPAGTRHRTPLLAHTALRAHVGDSRQHVIPCPHGCGGWHIVRRPE